jgi:SAM-dependent methyltransferase
MDSYNSQQGADEYIQFMASENGQIEQQILFPAIAERLGNGHLNALDAACGQGWLTEKLAEKYQSAKGCDASEYLIKYATAHYPKGTFEVADITKGLPYPAESFDAVVLNMAAHDLHDQIAAFKNIFSVLKPGGKLVMTIANPYYAYPVGVWKRGILGRLLFKKPRLLVRPYNVLRRQTRKFAWGNFLTPYFYPLSEQVNNALNVSFALRYFQDLSSETDSKQFNMIYQLYRQPTMLLLEFVKPKI